jgi:hypothetical protein
MLRRLGPMALTIGSLLSAGSASAQPPAPYAEGMATMPAMAAPVSTGVGDPTNHAAPKDGRIIRTGSAFEAYSAYDEIRSRANQRPLWEEPSERPGDIYRTSGCADDCGPGGHGKHGKGHGDGHGGLGGGLLGRLGGLGDGADRGYGPDFDCASCWRWANFEHKTFAAYTYLVPLRTATKVGYGKANGATVGTEWLPWVSRDDARHFSRWGLLTAFDYHNFSGNRNDVLVSQLSGNALSSAGGNSFGALLGPVFRSDFFLFGVIRMSPSVSVGLDLNWTTMRETEPAIFPPPPVPRPDPQPTYFPDQGLTVRSIEKFKYTDFCWGPYGRVVFDFPIRQKLNLGIGMDLRISKTETFVRHDEARKHFGLILQITGEF